MYIGTTSGVGVISQGEGNTSTWGRARRMSSREAEQASSRVPGAGLAAGWPGATAALLPGGLM